MTTCLETFEKERFCSFPHRHGDATGKPETREETRGRRKTSISCETSSNFDTFDTLSNKLECHKVPRLPRKTTWQPAWKPSKRRRFAASPIDTATPPGNRRLETRHVNAEKRAFRARRPPIFTVGNMTKGQVLQLPPLTRRGHRKTRSQNRCFVRGFRKFSAHRTKCHACHGICTLSPLDAALPMRFTKNTQHDTSKSAAPATKNDDGHVQSAAPATKNATHLLKTSQKYCTCHTKRLSTRYTTRLNVTKCHACHAKRSNETFETYKKHPSCRTYHRHGHIAIARTVANGCERLRTVATVNATSSEHTLNPQTPRVKKEPLLRIREKLITDMFVIIWYNVLNRLLVGGLGHLDYFSIYREFHHPNWRSHIFQRGRYTTNEIVIMELTASI